MILGHSSFADRPPKAVHFLLAPSNGIQKCKNLQNPNFRVREFSKSVDIIKEGDDGDEIFVLEEGKIEVYYTEDDGSE